MKFKFLALPNLLIILSILVLWLIISSVVEPFLHYYFQQSGFLTSFDFFKSYLIYPGGISDYFAEFIAQFFSFNTFGSLLIVAVAALQGFIALNLSRRLIGHTKFDYSIFTLVLLVGVLVLADYRYPYYVSVRLLLSYIFIWIFSVLNNKYQEKSLYLWPVLALLLFYIGNGAALFVFTVSSSIILIHTRKMSTWLVAMPLLVVFAAVVPYLSFKFIFQTSLLNLYRIVQVKPPEMLAYTSYVQVYIYYSILPAILFAGLLLKEKSEGSRSGVTQENPKAKFYTKNPFLISIQVLACVAIGYFLFIKTFDPLKKKLLYIEYYAEFGKWNDVLKVSETIADYDFRVNYQVNRANEHLGKLPDQLFHYPQLLGSAGLFFDASSVVGSLTMPVSDLYYDLGLMSESIHWAFEAQTLLPNSPRILKRIIMVNLINQKYNVAEIFLNVLGQNLLYHDWVEKYRKYVSDPTLADNDPEIAEKRRFSPQVKALTITPIDNLKLLLETNKNNRMAYDYLLTLCILDSRFNEFIEFLQEYRNYNIKTLPVSWAEALSIYILKTKAVPPFVNAETVSKECMQQFAAFNTIMKQYRNDRESARPDLKRDFEHTFWYYILYLSPRVTNVLNNKTNIQ